MFPAKPDIRLVDLTEPRGLFLSQDEEERAARFRFERDRVRWSRSRSALRSALAEELGVRNPLDLTFVLGPHGKPSLIGCALHFNLSHSGDWAMIAISREAPVGIDIERVRAEVDMGRLLERIGEDAPPVSAEELFQIWARREARSKAAGGMLFTPPDQSVQATDLPAPAGYVAAVAVACISIG